MKNNRIICAVLVCAVMLSSNITMIAPMTANAEEETTENEKYASEVKTMTALGFMKSMDTDDEYAAVTKAMFTAAVVELMGYGEYSYESAPQFADVSESDPFYREIMIAAQHGIVHGDDYLNFNPDSLITYTDAVVILENAMGYYMEANINGGYPDGYISTSISMGLNEGLDTGTDGRLNVGMCARLLLNAGEASVTNVVQNGTSQTYTKGDTLFWERHKISKGSGIVRANEQTSIDSSSGAGKNGIIIGDMQGYVYFSNESTEYLGYNVDYYYRVEDSDNIVLYMEPKNMNVTSINGADIEEFTDQTLSYSEGTRIRKETIPKDASVIYNGVYTIDYFFDDGTSIFDPVYGDVKLIDNNNDGLTDIISVLAYKNIVVSAVDKTEGIVYDKYSADKNLDYSDASDLWVITDSSGNVMSFEDLQKWDVVSVAKSRNGEVLRAVTTRNSFTGTINSIGEMDGKKKIGTENGEFYVTTGYTDIKGLPDIGSTVTFYLDYYNNIAAIDQTGSGKTFGFLIKSYYDISQDACIAKMLTAEGSVENIPFASKVKIDGSSYSGDDLRTLLGAEGEDGLVVPEPSEYYSYSVFEYKMNQDGQITYVDTVKKGTGEDENTLYRVNNYSGTYLWFATPRLFGRGPNSVVIGSDTNILKTPPKDSINDTEDYAVGSSSEFIYGIDYTVNAYSTNADSVIPEVVHMPLIADDPANMPRNARTCLITNIIEAANDDNEIVYEIKYFSGDQEYTSYTTEDVDASGLQEGDIIKVTLNAHNEISSINHVYSVETLSFTPDNLYGTHNEDFGNEYQPYDAKLFVLDGDVVGITKEINENTTFADCTFQRITDTDTAIYVVKSGRKKNQVTRITTADLPSVMDYYHNGHETSLYLMTTYGISKFLVIYELDE